MIKQCIIPKASSIHPPLSSSWDHIYPEVANLPHYKRFCFQSKLSKNIPVLETRAVRAHQRGLGSLSRTWASAGPTGLIDRVSIEVLVQVEGVPSAPASGGGGCKALGSRQCTQKEWLHGLHTTWLQGLHTCCRQLPFHPNTLGQHVLFENCRWVSAMTLLPFYTAENKLERSRKYSQTVKTEAEKLNTRLCEAAQYGEHQLQLFQRKDSKSDSKNSIHEKSKKWHFRGPSGQEVPHSWFLSSASLGHLSWRTWAALLCRQWLQPLVLRQKSSVYSGERYEMFREGAWDAHSSSRGARKIWLSLLKTPKLYPHKGSLWMEGGGGLGLSNCPLNPATGLDRWWCSRGARMLGT